jgi:HKD family nuclease
LSNDLVELEGEILKAVFTRADAHFSDFDLHLKEITPYTRLTHSELFTGGNVGLSLESELKKEILSADRIDLLVSFIKFKGIIILERELQEFTKRGGKLRVITTTYMGASDYKAIQLLSKLDNTEVKIHTILAMNDYTLRRIYFIEILDSIPVISVLPIFRDQP